MNKEQLKIAIKDGYIEWQRHAFERMMERGISMESVKTVLLTGEIIEEYPDDKLYPSALFFGRIRENPLHVVAAFDYKSNYCFIITAYKPDLEHFESDYKTRRKHGD